MEHLKKKELYRVIIFIIRSYAHQIKHIAEKGLEVYPMSSISISLQSCLCTSAENDSELTRAQLGPRGHGMHWTLKFSQILMAPKWHRLRSIMGMCNHYLCYYHLNPEHVCFHAFSLASSSSYWVNGHNTRGESIWTAPIAGEKVPINFP